MRTQRSSETAVVVLAIGLAIGALSGVVHAQPLVITEVFANPDEVPDADGEWFEVFNPCLEPVDLRGLTIRDATGTPQTISALAPVLVPPQSFAVLAREADPLINGGVPVDYEYSGSLSLNNGGDSIIIERDGKLVDAFEYEGSSVRAGVSLSLDPSRSSSPICNDDLQNWCDATIVFSGASLGTPGEINDVCAGVGMMCDPVVCAFDCLADANGDGALTPGDFNAWVLAFNAQAPACDQNRDGDCAPNDFNAWILNFNAGCP
ncbi:MAG: lamin tail domain-containing protein [Planctomycetota bacterium]